MCLAAKKPKQKNRSNVVTESIKDFKNGPHPKKKSFKKGNAPSRGDNNRRTASFVSNRRSGHTPRNNLLFLPFKDFLGDRRVFQVLPVPRNPVQSKGQSAVSICFLFPHMQNGLPPNGLEVRREGGLLGPGTLAPLLCWGQGGETVRGRRCVVMETGCLIGGAFSSLLLGPPWGAEAGWSLHR